VRTTPLLNHRIVAAGFAAMGGAVVLRLKQLQSD
jgi:hypothetical protein